MDTQQQHNNHSVPKGNQPANADVPPAVVSLRLFSQANAERPKKTLLVLTTKVEFLKSTTTTHGANYADTAQQPVDIICGCHDLVVGLKKSGSLERI